MKKIIGILLLLTFCSLASFAQSKNQAFSHNEFMEKVDSVQIGYSKDKVKAIMGAPYKVAFVKYKDQGLVEQLSYRVKVFRGSWAMINYSFTFYNSALIALVETEVLSSSTIHSDHNSIGYFIKNILPFILPDKQEKKSQYSST